MISYAISKIIIYI